MTRRALVIGINYHESATQTLLRGCINDAKHMSELLSGIGYTVTMLTDDDPDAMPTARRILRELLALVSAPEGSELVLHYSGHGVYVSDTNGDERDGRDECIVSSDDQIIRDDTLNQIIRMLPPSCALTCIMDACHSGSILDLPYKLHSAPPATPPSCARVTLLSACMDSQTAADTTDLRPGIDTYGGAMSSALLFCLKYTHNWPELVKLIRFVLRKRRHHQVPQLTASFDVNADFVAKLLM